MNMSKAPTEVATPRAEEPYGGKITAVSFSRGFCDGSGLSGQLISSESLISPESVLGWERDEGGAGLVSRVRALAP